MKRKHSKFPHPCSVRNCRRKVGRDEHSDKCPRHRLLAWKSKHPAAYAWGHLKRRARARGIAFTLTLAEYTAFAIKTDITKLSGRTSLSLSVDRIEGGCGYHFWNIQALQVRENSRKQFVAYFNGGVLPQKEAHEYRLWERERSDKLELLAEQMGQKHGFGTKLFWSEFNGRKEKLFESELV